MVASSLADEAVALRPWSTPDADWYAETVRHDVLIQRFTTESATVTADAVRAAIVALLAGPTDAAGFLVADAVTGDRLGNIALSHRAGVGDVSYWLAGHARGRGVATRALRLFSGWAFANLGLRELRLWAHVDNAGSRAVAERAGYRRDPERDESRLVWGQRWQTVSYVLRRLPG